MRLIGRKTRSSAAAVAGSVWQPQTKQDRKKKFIHVQKNRRNAGAGENADPVKRAPSETRLLDVTGGAEDFQPSGHLQPV